MTTPTEPLLSNHHHFHVKNDPIPVDRVLRHYFTLSPDVPHKTESFMDNHLPLSLPRKRRTTEPVAQDDDEKYTLRGTNVENSSSSSSNNNNNNNNLIHTLTDRFLRFAEVMTCNNDRNSTNIQPTIDFAPSDSTTVATIHYPPTMTTRNFQTISPSHHQEQLLFPYNGGRIGTTRRITRKIAHPSKSDIDAHQRNQKNQKAGQKKKQKTTTNQLQEQYCQVLPEKQKQSTTPIDTPDQKADSSPHSSLNVFPLKLNDDKVQETATLEPIHADCGNIKQAATSSFTGVSGYLLQAAMEQQQLQKELQTSSNQITRSEPEEQQQKQHNSKQTITGQTTTTRYLLQDYTVQDLCKSIHDALEPVRIQYGLSTLQLVQDSFNPNGGYNTTNSNNNNSNCNQNQERLVSFEAKLQGLVQVYIPSDCSSSSGSEPIKQSDDQTIWNRDCHLFGCTPQDYAIPRIHKQPNDTKYYDRLFTVLGIIIPSRGSSGSSCAGNKKKKNSNTDNESKKTASSSRGSTSTNYKILAHMQRDPIRDSRKHHEWTDSNGEPNDPFNGPLVYMTMDSFRKSIPVMDDASYHGMDL